jgi:putative transposase
MADERAYYHVVITVARGRQVFLVPEIDAAFKVLVAEIAHTKGWLLLALETMPNHVHLLIEKPPWTDLSAIVRQIKGSSARRLRQQFDWLPGDLPSGHLWTRGHHYTRHTDASLDTVLAYIRNQRRAGGLEP